MVLWSISGPCSRGRNRCKNRIRRSSWAALSLMARAARSPMATAGCRMVPARNTATSASSCPSSSKWRSEAGRDPASIPVTLFGVPADLDRLRYYRDAGVARVVVSLNSAGPEEVQHGRDPTMDLGLKGKKAIVCAASKGLGKACAMSLAREGVDLVITARTASELEATAAEIAPRPVRKSPPSRGRHHHRGRPAAALAACPTPTFW
jgi:hypothetical protein